MRALAILLLGIVVSSLVSGVFQVAVGLALDAREEMFFALVVELLVALVVALVFAAVLATRGGARAITFAAATMAVLGVVALAGLEAFALADQAAAIDPSDIPLMIEIGVPGLATIVLQAWLVRTLLQRDTARATLVPSEG